MKKLSILALIFITLFSFTGCKEKEIVVMDREGNEFTINNGLERIISTAPSNTEILIGLGLADKIVAVDNYSPTDALSSDITLIDFRNPDAEVIIGLEPDIIIASGHNKSGAEDPFAIIKEAGILVVYIPSSNSIEGIYGDIEFIADITDTVKEGKAIVENMQSEIEAIKSIASTIITKKKVYFEIAPAPNIYTTGLGTFQNELLELVGAKNIFGNEEGWIAASAEIIIQKNPEVILTNVSYMPTPVEEILTREGFGNVDAIVNNQVFLIDANASSRPSQKVIDSIKEIAKVVYPEFYE